MNSLRHSSAAANRARDRSRYRFGRTLGAGTYGIVREADCPEGKVAVKIILKKNVKGNEKLVYDELKMLQKMKHPHIVRFHDWFESKVSSFGHADALSN
jgi:calcium/calmodulin-dependent protein kinase I